MTPLQRVLTALLGATALASCAQTPPEPASQRLARELRAAIGPARCSSDAQCRSLPVGAKPCGGPAGYWAWSTEGTDAARVQALARQQAEAQKREIEASGLLSDCRITTDPGAACVAQRCELASPAAGGAAAR